jgi:hypothetical protein
MTSTPRFFLTLLVGIAGATAALIGTEAAAQKLSPAQRNDLTKPWLALDRCAVYGPDFTSVEGTQTCVRIGGHVRVELGPRAPGQAGAAPAAMRTEGLLGGDSDFPGADHLRLRQDAAPTYDGNYLR